MRRQEDLVVAAEQPFQRVEESRHVALRRRNHGGVPAHYVIAGEHGSLSDQREAEMIRSVARRMQHVERGVADLHHIAVLQLTIGPEGWIDEGLAKARRSGATFGVGRAEAHDVAAE